MTTTFVGNVNLTTMTCSCGGVYALQEHFRDEKQRNGGHWWCPYCGTRRVYTETETARLKRQLDVKETEIVRERQKHDQTKAQLRMTELRRRAEKGHRTRVARRIANGICPCCNRHFENLHRHMQDQHPEFVPSVEAPAE